MKTIFHILIILVVAVLLGGLFYGAVTAFSFNTSQAQATDRPLPPEGEFDRPSPDGETGSLQFPFDSVKNLLIITAVGAVYLNAPKLLGKRKPQPEIA
jgi:hypothetical protein